MKKESGIDEVKEESAEMHFDLSEQNPEHYMFIPMLVAAVCDRNSSYQENHIRSTDRNIVCQLVQAEAKKCGLNEEVRNQVQKLIMDNSFAKNVLQ